MEDNSRKKFIDNSENEKLKDKNIKKRRKQSKNIFKNFLKKIDSKTKNKTIISSTSINDANKKENDNQKIKTTRNPGVDLLRIISMYSVVVHHYLVFGKDDNHFPQYRRQLSFVHSVVDRFQVLFYSVGIHKYLVNYKKGYYVKKIWK